MKVDRSDSSPILSSSSIPDVAWLEVVNISDWIPPESCPFKRSDRTSYTSETAICTGLSVGTCIRHPGHTRSFSQSGTEFNETSSLSLITVQKTIHLTQWLTTDKLLDILLTTFISWEECCWTFMWG